MVVQWEIAEMVVVLEILEAELMDK